MAPTPQTGFWNKSCIYFLCFHGRVIYIGQTTQLGIRIRDHGTHFDTVRWIECPKDKLRFYEKRWIKRFKPPFNILDNSERTVDGKWPYKNPTWFYNLKQSEYMLGSLLHDPYSDKEKLRLEYEIALKRIAFDYKRDGYKNSFLDEERWHKDHLYGPPITSKRFV